MHPRWDAGCPTPQLQTPGTTYCCLLMPHWSTCSAAKNRPEQMGDGGDASTLGFRPPDTTVADAWDCILLSANATPEHMLGSKLHRPEQTGDGGNAATLGCRPPDTTVANAWDYILLSANAAAERMLGSEITIHRLEQTGDRGNASTLGCRPPDTTVADAWDCILLSVNATPDPMLSSEITQTRAWESQSGRRWHGCQRPSVCSPTRVQGNRDGWASGWTAGWRVVRPPELLNHLLYH